MCKYYYVNEAKNGLEIHNGLDNAKIYGAFLKSIENKLNEFKEVYIVNCLQDYIFIINYLLLGLKDKHENSRKTTMCKYIYRGVSKLEEFDSKIVRNNDINRLNNEFLYIRKFEENGSIKLGQFNNPIDLAAAADHYGIHTRLIDWSYNPFVATLFSLYSLTKKNQSSAVLVYNTNNAVILNSLIEDFNLANAPLYKRYESMIKNYQSLIQAKNAGNQYYIYEYFKNVFEKTYVGDYNDRYKYSANKFLNSAKVLLDTNYSNERIVSQRGLFEIQSIDDKNDFSKTSIILISSNARNDIIKYINYLGTNYYSLMNDPASASGYINDTILGKLNYKWFEKKVWR